MNITANLINIIYVKVLWNFLTIIRLYICPRRMCSNTNVLKLRETYSKFVKYLEIGYLTLVSIFR